MTHDNINNPAHYNKNGIEVIDVIETYTPNSPHLANVLKYVCRHSYKGKPLEDLRKAQWYLARYIDILEEQAEEEAWVEEQMKHPAAVALVEDDEFEPEFDAYGRVLRAAPPVNIYGDIITDTLEGVTGDVYLSLDRIAGDDSAARVIKDAYYGFDRFLIVGYCANCDKELKATDAYITNVLGFEELKFCSGDCVRKLQAWQRGER